LTFVLWLVALPVLMAYLPFYRGYSWELDTWMLALVVAHLVIGLFGCIALAALTGLVVELSRGVRTLSAAISRKDR
jgi:hypothetical protein